MEKLSLTQEIIDSVRNVVEVVDRYALVKPDEIIPLDEFSPARWIYNSGYAVSIEDWEKNVYAVLFKSFIKKISSTVESSTYEDVIACLGDHDQGILEYHYDLCGEYYYSIGYRDYEKEEYEAVYFSMYEITKFEVELDESIDLNELEDDFIDMIPVLINSDGDLEGSSVFNILISENNDKLEIWCINDGEIDADIDINYMKGLFIKFINMIKAKK